MRLITTPDIGYQDHQFDVCVVGGGMAGMIAALASARNGARTALVHDRPVLGGNASSEVRMWICGAHGRHNKETGILEEIQLENQYRNPSLNFSIWDSVLYGHVANQPNLTVFLNTSCADASMTDGYLTAIRCWQPSSQTWHRIEATQYVDTSGDSILAALTGADNRIGREAREEFDEDIEPSVGDDKTMGNSILLQAVKTQSPQPFVAPKWAYKFTDPADLEYRVHGLNSSNFWWIELGGINDTIKDAEAIRHDLTKVVYGIWDYLKNHAPDRDKAANWGLAWIGSVPGKRESRRYVGDHTLTQNDIRAEGKFHDTVAYGGWSMDDHHPAGLYYPGRPTLFHPAPSPYGIPFRCLYSRAVPNLLCAGRNISTTHAALSSTRVMGTTSLLGQAAGTAAALCIRHGVTPRELGQRHITELQQTLMDDDVWLPGMPRPISGLMREGRISVDDGDAAAARLIDGLDRDREEADHGVDLAPGQAITMRWETAREIPGIRLIADSNLDDHKRMPCMFPQPGEINRLSRRLVRAYRVEAQNADGSWSIVHHEANSHQRLIRLPLGITTHAIRLIPEATWGGENARFFAAEAVTQGLGKDAQFPEGPRFVELRATMDPADLEQPESDTPETRKHGWTA